MSLRLPFEHTYAELPAQFFTKMAPTPVRAPSLLKLNEPLAETLGLDPTALSSPEGVAILGGNAVAPGTIPLAQVYAGHQFGGFSPQLGDGRAILLGEVVANGRRYDVQLKGSGPTPYSRMGDGRAWLGPVLREYICSEAMAALGVPTTRALAAVATGETVVREAPLPGAIFTRVAASHLRVGTFQYFAARQDTEALRALCDYARARHDPEAPDALAFLEGVIARQARLVAKWMGLGFIHGVMNTDNTTISGETIDYGPCAFMDAYHPMRVYSSIDRQGRYAYARQPQILMWNLAQLATSLLPLIEDRDAAQAALDAYPALYETAWLDVFRAKLGLTTTEDDDAALIQTLLDRMAEDGADFTNAFRGLSGPAPRDQFLDREAFDAWADSWVARLAREDARPEDRRDALDQANPAVVPRLHLIEATITAAVDGDMAAFEALLAAATHPYAVPENPTFMRPPTEDEIVPRTFCGT